MPKLATLRNGALVAIVVTGISALPPSLEAGGRHAGDHMKTSRFCGAWYAELDAEPFHLPPGTALAALMTIHCDGTLQLFDAGDFGAPPISLVQSPQYGSWARSGRRSIRGTTLFFAGSPTNRDTTLVKRARFRLWFEGDDDRLVGVAESVDQLECPASPPPGLPGFLSCPNPITAPETAWAPEPGGAPNVGFQAWRLRAR
jgi:hypothetical protein